MRSRGDMPPLFGHQNQVKGTKVCDSQAAFGFSFTNMAPSDRGDISFYLKRPLPPYINLLRIQYILFVTHHGRTKKDMKYKGVVERMTLSRMILPLNDSSFASI